MQKSDETTDIKHTQVEVQKNDKSIHAGVYQGPIPLPSIMEGYKKIDPSFPERIMKEFETNSAHIRKAEERAQLAEIEKDKRGQWMAFVLTILLLVVIFFSLYLGNMTFAGIGGLVFIAWIIKSFNMKISTQRKDNKPTKRN